MTKRKDLTMFTRAITTITVRDLNAALEFYCRVLGFHVVHRIYDRIVYVEAPGMLIALRPRDVETEISESSHVHIGLTVSDMETARQSLESRGVVFIGDTVDARVVQLAFFNDPDGTPLYLCQWTQWVESAA